MCIYYTDPQHFNIHYALYDPSSTCLLLLQAPMPSLDFNVNRYLIWTRCHGPRLRRYTADAPQESVGIIKGMVSFAASCSSSGLSNPHSNLMLNIYYQIHIILFNIPGCINNPISCSIALINSSMSRWWCVEPSLSTIAQCLYRDRYVIIDDFLPIADARTLARQVWCWRHYMELFLRLMYVWLGFML
jgi:hypothetical protein